ncbi:jg2708, partial [Pararge aegeria aegeria]
KLITLFSIEGNNNFHSYVKFPKEHIAPAASALITSLPVHPVITRVVFAMTRIHRRSLNKRAHSSPSLAAMNWQRCGEGNWPEEITDIKELKEVRDCGINLP